MVNTLSVYFQVSLSEHCLNSQDCKKKRRLIFHSAGDLVHEFKLLHKQMATFSFPLPFLSMEHHCLQVTNPEICLLTELIAKAAYAV